MFLIPYKIQQRPTTGFPSGVKYMGALENLMVGGVGGLELIHGGNMGGSRRYS